MNPVSSRDRINLIWSGSIEENSVVECQDRAEDSDRDGGNDDRADVAPKPDDENRGEGGFRQTVEHDEIRLQNL